MGVYASYLPFVGTGCGIVIVSDIAGIDTDVVTTRCRSGDMAAAVVVVILRSSPCAVAAAVADYNVASAIARSKSGIGRFAGSPGDDIVVIYICSERVRIAVAAISATISTITAIAAVSAATSTLSMSLDEPLPLLLWLIGLETSATPQPRINALLFSQCTASMHSRLLFVFYGRLPICSSRWLSN